MLPKRHSDRAPPSSCEVKKVCSYTFTPRTFHDTVTKKERDKFAFAVTLYNNNNKVKKTRSSGYRRETLKAETESEIVAAQTRRYKQNILRQNIENRDR